MDNYLAFDRKDIGQASLDEAISCLKRVGKNPFIWKYAIISIHNALQCYMTIALRGSSGTATWKKHDAKKWQEAYDNNKELPSVQLDNFMKLYNKLFVDKDSEERLLIDWLNSTRNEFIHFNSDSFSVCRASLTKAFQQALTDIKLTPSLSKGIFFYDDADEKKYRNSCAELDKLVGELKLNKSKQSDA